MKALHACRSGTHWAKTVQHLPVLSVSYQGYG